MCTKRVRELAKKYHGDKQLNRVQPIRRGKLKEIGQMFDIGIRVYEPEENDEVWRQRRLLAHYDNIGIKQMTIGVYNNHAFLIRDIKAVIKIYACGDCDQQFTRSHDLTRHCSICSKGQTKVVCPGKEIKTLWSAFENPALKAKRPFVGSRRRGKREKPTFITPFAGTEENEK